MTNTIIVGRKQVCRVFQLFLDTFTGAGFQKYAAVAQLSVSHTQRVPRRLVERAFTTTTSSEKANLSGWKIHQLPTGISVFPKNPLLFVFIFSYSKSSIFSSLFFFNSFPTVFDPSLLFQTT